MTVDWSVNVRTSVGGGPPRQRLITIEARVSREFSKNLRGPPGKTHRNHVFIRPSIRSSVGSLDRSIDRTESEFFPETDFVLSVVGVELFEIPNLRPSFPSSLPPIP